MKDYTYEFGTKEEGHQKEPYEIYDFWYGTAYWRYTSGDISVNYNENTYEPAPIERGIVTYDSNLEVSTLDIIMARSQGFVTKYIVQNPVLVLWVKVTRLFRDLSEPDIVFIGQIKNVTFTGLTAKVSCVGFEKYFKQPIPNWRYQILCNYKVFDNNCSLSDNFFKTTTNIDTVSSDNLTITSNDFSLQDSDYYKLGKIVFGEDSRMITYHVGNTIKIRFRMPNLVPGSEVTVYAGCDRNIETCRDKFNNVINFGGHPYIPLDNPVLWI